MPKLENFVSDFTIINIPSFQAIPKKHGCRTETVIAINIEEKLVLIGGTEYAGENKKAVFTILNYLLPKKGILPMHCAAIEYRINSPTQRYFLAFQVQEKRHYQPMVNECS